MCWTDEFEQEDTQTHKERKSVLTVDDFLSDAGYTLTKKSFLNVFMCSSEVQLQ